MNQDEIKKQAKQIMDDFMNALEKAGDIKEEVSIRREQNTRVPSRSKYNGEIKKRILENAPKCEDGCIIAERKKW